MVIHKIHNIDCQYYNKQNVFYTIVLIKLHKKEIENNNNCIKNHHNNILHYNNK